MKIITIERDGDGIATLTFDLKDRSMNVLTPEFVGDLAQAVEQLAADDAVRGVICGEVTL